MRDRLCPGKAGSEGKHRKCACVPDPLWQKLAGSCLRDRAKNYKRCQKIRVKRRDDSIAMQAHGCADVDGRCQRITLRLDENAEDSLLASTLLSTSGSVAYMLLVSAFFLVEQFSECVKTLSDNQSQLHQTYPSFMKIGKRSRVDSGCPSRFDSTWFGDPKRARFR